MTDQHLEKCYICGMYDENKDPSLWLVCEPDSPKDWCCRLTCHMECAFRWGNLGVNNTAGLRPLDGNYWCTSCGKVSEILACWKQQLSIAKDARCVDDLCHRISLSYRLMDRSVRFEALHEIVKVAKSMLDAELGPINHCSYKIGRGMVNRLSVARDVQKLCVDAIEKADGWLASGELDSREDRYPPACRILFGEIASSSLTIILVDTPTARTDSVKGYNIWCWRSKHKASPYEPNSSFPTFKRKVKISRLQPSSEYIIRAQGPHRTRIQVKIPDMVQLEGH